MFVLVSGEMADNIIKYVAKLNDGIPQALVVHNQQFEDEFG